MFDNARAGVVILVHAMPEAHEFGFASLHALYECGNILNRPDFHQHSKNFFIRAAMQRAVERGNGGSRSGVGIDMRTADTSNRISRAILLVVSVKNEKNVQSALECRIGPVLGFRSAKEHVQKISRIA